MVKLDSKKDLFTSSLISSSELNLQEFRRVVKKIRLEGKAYNEKYDQKITKTILEDKSKYRVHVIYVWEKSEDDDIDRLRMIHVKKVKK